RPGGGGVERLPRLPSGARRRRARPELPPDLSRAVAPHRAPPGLPDTVGAERVRPGRRPAAVSARHCHAQAARSPPRALGRPPLLAAAAPAIGAAAITPPAVALPSTRRDAERALALAARVRGIPCVFFPGTLLFSRDPSNRFDLGERVLVIGEYLRERMLSAK